MGLWEAAGMEAPVRVNRYAPRDRFLPVVALEDQAMLADNAARLTAIALEQIANEATLNSLETTLLELLENCFAHSEIEDGLYAMACAQNVAQR
jgi:hypothetical protein